MGETHTDQTLKKVHDELILFMPSDDAEDAITALLNAGILFRERTDEPVKNKMQSDIELFMTACDQEVKNYPYLPPKEIRNLRIHLMVEELLGTTKEGWNIEGAPYSDILVPSKSDELIQSMLNDDLVGIADGIADVLYVVIGTAAAYGIDIQEVFDEVQRSNMTKAVWNEETSEWTTIKNEVGKVLKPETFSPADIESIINLQTTRGMRAAARRGELYDINTIHAPQPVSETIFDTMDLSKKPAHDLKPLAAKLIDNPVDFGGWEDR